MDAVGHQRTGMHRTVTVQGHHTQPVQFNRVIGVILKDRLAAVAMLHCVHWHAG